MTVIAWISTRDFPDRNRDFQTSNFGSFAIAITYSVSNRHCAYDYIRWAGAESVPHVVESVNWIGLNRANVYSGIHVASSFLDGIFKCRILVVTDVCDFKIKQTWHSAKFRGQPFLLFVGRACLTWTSTSSARNLVEYQSLKSRSFLIFIGQLGRGFFRSVLPVSLAG